MAEPIPACSAALKWLALDGWLVQQEPQRKQPALIRSAKPGHPISRPCVCGRGFKQQVRQLFGWAAAGLISPAYLAQPNRLYISSPLKFIFFCNNIKLLPKHKSP